MINERGEKVTPAEYHEEMQMKAMERQRVLNSRTLPPSSPDDAEDLREERKKRRLSVYHLIDEGLIGRNRKHYMLDNDDKDLISQGTDRSPSPRASGLLGFIRQSSATFIPDSRSPSAARRVEYVSSAPPPPSRMRSNSTVVKETVFGTENTNGRDDDEDSLSILLSAPRSINNNNQTLGINKNTTPAERKAAVRKMQLL